MMILDCKIVFIGNLRINVWLKHGKIYFISKSDREKLKLAGVEIEQIKEKIK